MEIFQKRACILGKKKKRFGLAIVWNGAGVKKINDNLGIGCKSPGDSRWETEEMQGQ